MPTDYETALQGQWTAELAEFGTTGLYRGSVVSGLFGISPLTANLRDVGFYDNQEADFYILAPTGEAPATRELITLSRGRLYEIKGVEPLDRDQAYRLILTKTK